MRLSIFVISLWTSVGFHLFICLSVLFVESRKSFENTQIAIQYVPYIKKQSGEKLEKSNSIKHLTTAKVQKDRNQNMDIQKTPLRDSNSKNTDSTSSSLEPTTSINGELLGIFATYPRLSRVLGEMGQVLIQVRRRNSKEVFFKLIKSSGYPRLDKSALLATKDATKKGVLYEQLLSKNIIEITFEFRLN